MPDIRHSGPGFTRELLSSPSRPIFRVQELALVLRDLRRGANWATLALKVDPVYLAIPHWPPATTRCSERRAPPGIGPGWRVAS